MYHSVRVVGYQSVRVMAVYYCVRLVGYVVCQVSGCVVQCGPVWLCDRVQCETGWLCCI